MEQHRAPPTTDTKSEITLYPHLAPLLLPHANLLTSAHMILCACVVGSKEVSFAADQDKQAA